MGCVFFFWHYITLPSRGRKPLGFLVCKEIERSLFCFLAVNDVVKAKLSAKGGALLLGVGPTAQGTIEQPIVNRLQTLGAWLRTNGKAIYGTRNAKVYHDGNVWFTADKDGKTLYAIYALPEGESLPAEIQWKGNAPKGKVRLLANGKSLKAKTKKNVTTVQLPKGLAQEALVLEFQMK